MRKDLEVFSGEFNDIDFFDLENFKQLSKISHPASKKKNRKKDLEQGRRSTAAEYHHTESSRLGEP